MFKSLPKNFEMKKKEIPFFYNDRWITNGVFAVSRHLIQDSYRYCLNKPNVIQPAIERIIPTQIGCIRMERTNRLYDMGDGDLARVFEDNMSNEYLVNEKYAAHFVLEILYTGDEKDLFHDENINIVIASMKHPNPKKLNGV